MPQAVSTVRTGSVRSRRERAIILLMALFIVGTAGTLWHLYRKSADLYSAMAVAGTALQARMLEEFRKLYTADVVARVRDHGIEATHDYAAAGKSGTIPLPATMAIELGDRISRETPGMHVRLYSDYPFPWRRNRPPLDAFEKEALAELRKDPDHPFSRFEQYEGRPSLRYALADRMEANCVTCHNQHADSPKTDWKLGDVRGVLEIIRPLDNSVAHAQAGMQWTLGLTVGAYGLGLLGLGFVIHRLSRTARKRDQAEEALDQERSLLRNLMDYVPDNIYFKDAEGRYLQINKAKAARSGLTDPAEAVGKTDFDFFPAEHARKTLADERNLMESGQALIGQEERLIWPDGHETWVSTTKVPLRDREGRVVGTFGISRDFTKRKQVEEALEKERYLLHALMDTLPDSIYFKDASSRFLRINKALADKFGLDDPSGAVGKTDFDFFTPEHAEQAAADERELIRSGQPVLGKEEQETWPDGHKTWVATSKLALRDAEGQIVGTFGISRDITERKQAEEALKESQRRTRLIVDTAYDAFVAMDEKGEIVDWNPQAAVIFGWTRQEALGRRLCDTVIPPHSREAHERGLKQFLATGKGPVLNKRIEIAALHRDGHEFLVELTISPIRLQNSYLFSAFVHDISERKQAEQAMRVAKEAAEAASRAKSNFLANMSHEIRTPMNAIIGMTELVLDTPLSLSQREYLTIVRESGESLLSVINEILDFSKIEAGKLDLEWEPFSLRESLGDTMKSLALRAHAKGLELACHIGAKVPDALVGDSFRVRQIVVNLVGNAIKFTERGEIVVDVSCESVADDEYLLHFSVTDTGIGIPEAKRALVFAPFEQADTSTTRRFGGTGLGLTISSRLVGLMGGRVWVESEVGRGSTFHFTARFGVPEGAATDVHLLQPASLRGMRVLIVDDNATNLRILEEMLTNWKMRPTAVPGVRAALETMHAAREPFRLVLTDANMPDLDGFNLAERIRAEEKFAGAVIMMLTSGDRTGDIARCERLGIAAYLMKPIKQSELFDAIVAAIGTAAHDVEAAHTVTDWAAPPTRALRVLLGEDSLVNQKLAVGLLRKWGHAVTVANNGKEAVAAFDAQPFDIVLMDVQMPEMDGLEATAAIRRREQKSGTHVPIIAMTAHAMKGDRERCLEAGMDAYVSKPIRAHELYASIEGFMQPAPQPVRQATEAARGNGVLDWSMALDAVQGDRDLLKEVVKAFLDECPRLIDQIGQAIGARDKAVLQRAAHTIKGATRTFGASAVTTHAVQLESMGKSGEFNGAEKSFGTLQEELNRLTSELLTFVGKEG